MPSDDQSAEDKRTIKQVADLYGTTLATLYYYERIGLFCAKREASNGYRVYCGEDFAHLNLIRTLQEMSTPLSEVKRYEMSHDLQTNIDVLSKELERVDKAIEELNARRKTVQTTLVRYTRALIDAPEERIDLLALPERPYILVENDLGADYNVPLLCAEKMHDLKTPLDVFTMIPSFLLDSRINKSGAYSAKQLALCSDSPIGIEDNSFPAGKYLSVAFRGPLCKTPEMHRRLLEKAKEEGLSVIGEPIEFWTINEYVTCTPEEFVRTLQQRVE